MGPTPRPEFHEKLAATDKMKRYLIAVAGQ